MKRKIILLLFLNLMLCMAACGQQEQPAEMQTDADTELVLDDEQVRKDIGEMLLVGFRGTAIDSQSHIVRDIKQYHVGSVILFEYDAPTGGRHRNVSSPSQLKKLCSDLQALSDEPLFISIDQEGGMVTRMKAKDGFARTMTAKASARGGDDSVRRNAQVVAQELREAGVNLNFAPCVDVDINPACPVIGRLERSFSSDPEVVSRCAAIWLEEQRKQGVVSCLKHFPGHGSAKGDTHAGLVDVSRTWQDQELEPYRKLIAEGKVDMVMVAHVICREMGDSLPASLSPKAIKQKLRGELGFQGVVITDDLAMGAIVKQYGFEEALRLAIAAGSDLLCLSNNGNGRYDADLVPKAVEAIMRMVHEGRLSAQDIHAAAERVRRLKELRIERIEN